MRKASSALDEIITFSMYESVEPLYLESMRKSDGVRWVRWLGAGVWGVGQQQQCSEDSRDGDVSVLRLSWLGTALQWRLSDSWHGLVHQHLLVLHFLS